MFIYDLAIFLTSTAFVDTKAKYGIPLSRYTVFLQNCPLGYAPFGLLLSFATRSCGGFEPCDLRGHEVKVLSFSGKRIAPAYATTRIFNSRF